MHLIYHRVHCNPCKDYKKEVGNQRRDMTIEAEVRVMYLLFLKMEDNHSYSGGKYLGDQVSRLDQKKLVRPYPKNK
jgi:deoxycytidine triphosphate deaminase